MTPSKRSIEERAARYQRRYAGPWRTVDREIGPIDLTYRYRRQRRIEAARWDVAGHDLWTHAIERGIILPLFRRLAALLSSRP